MTRVHARGRACARRRDRQPQGGRAARRRGRRAPGPRPCSVRAALPETPGGPAAAASGAGRGADGGAPLRGGFAGRAAGPVLQLVLKFTCLRAGPAPGDAAFPTEPRGPGWAGCGPQGRARTGSPALLREVRLGLGAGEGPPRSGLCTRQAGAAPGSSGTGYLPVWGERRQNGARSQRAVRGTGWGARQGPLQLPVGQGPLGNSPRTPPTSPARRRRARAGLGPGTLGGREGRLAKGAVLSVPARGRPGRPPPSCLQPVPLRAAGPPRPQLLRISGGRRPPAPQRLL